MNDSALPYLNIHYRFMTQAILLAEKAAEADEVPVGAVVVYKNTIIGKGYNQVEALKDPTAHAEIIALTAACNTLGEKYLNDCTLYVTLEPCAMCAGALVNAKLGQLVFAAADAKAGACGSVFNICENKQLNHSVKTIQGILEDDAEYLLRQFFKGKR